MKPVARHVRLGDTPQPVTKIVLSIPATVDVAEMVRKYNEQAEANGLPRILSAEKQDD
ncbi:hypothetical protein EVC24_141 [Rhizobium phage RHph_I4]|nr:hypothetical protein EVC24_141 [Rhizobium phage RHph_I4]